jgi:hypothetical protein
MTARGLKGRIHLVDSAYCELTLFLQLHQED